MAFDFVGGLRVRPSPAPPIAEYPPCSTSSIETLCQIHPPNRTPQCRTPHASKRYARPMLIPVLRRTSDSRRIQIRALWQANERCGPGSRGLTAIKKKCTLKNLACAARRRAPNNHGKTSDFLVVSTDLRCQQKCINF
jgi:hypothetical protein